MNLFVRYSCRLHISILRDAREEASRRRHEVDVHKVVDVLMILLSTEAL